MPAHRQNQVAAMLPLRDRRLPAAVWVIAVAGFYLALSAISAGAQTQATWPELDAYVKLSPVARLFFSAQATREETATSQADFGAHIDLQLGHLRRLDLLRREPDESKSHPVLLRIGYHYILPLSDTAKAENRLVIEATPRYPLKGGFVVADRDRVDLRFTGGQFLWRYRNRLSVERSLGIGSYRFTPYARLELWYDSAYAKWDKVGSFAGCEFPVNKRLAFEAYVEHQNDTSKSPNRQVNGLGLTSKLYF